jgi:hypothetical protein
MYYHTHIGKVRCGVGNTSVDMHGPTLRLTRSSAEVHASTILNVI